MQSFQNHRRVDLGWVSAFLSMLLITVLYILSTIGRLSDKIMWILPFVMIIVGWILLLKLRMYATKLQDRIIRQEVAFRYFVMTSKPIDTRISLKQMIALRFASDEQFIDLCQQAAKDGLSPTEIKERITDWQADSIRV